MLVLLCVGGSFEALSIFLLMARWSKKYLNGDYGPHDGKHVDAFFGHLLLGMIPLFGLAFLYGDWTRKKELIIAKREKELENVQEDVRKILR